jgi:beta-1,4-mannosyl-glycoprotein beta-1,4-N-acetylglucosaminyltransferase
MKVVDCFTFYNEIQLLTYRLAILDDVVDYFVIVEATHTFAGYEKELYFEKNKELFSKYLHKIIHIVVDDIPYKQPNIDFSQNHQWTNEHFQRSCISRGINQLILLDDDILMISDLDEVPDPKTVLKVKNNEIQISIASFDQDIYYYNLTTRVPEQLNGLKILQFQKYKKLNISCQEIRQSNESIKHIIPNGGWHLDHFGDKNFMLNKLKHFSHQEYNNSFYTSLDFIEKCIKDKVSVFTPEKQLLNIEIKNNNFTSDSNN